MKQFLTRSREGFICGCWSPRIHRRFCCSRRWLSRSPWVNIFGQRLSCRSCWCCPRVNRSSWFGTCQKKKANSNTSQYRFTLESFPRRSNSFMSHYCLLMLNTKRWSNSILGTPIKSQNLRYTCRRNKQTKFCGRQMNNTKLPFETEF